MDPAIVETNFDQITQAKAVKLLFKQVNSDPVFQAIRIGVLDDHTYLDMIFLDRFDDGFHPAQPHRHDPPPCTHPSGRGQKLWTSPRPAGTSAPPAHGWGFPTSTRTSS